MAKNRIKGITIELNGDTTPLQKALQSANRVIKDTQISLKDVNKLLELDPGNVELLTQKQDYLNQAIESTRDKLEKEKTALEQMKASNSTGEITNQQRELEREIIETENSLKGLEGELKEFGSVGKQQSLAVAQEMAKVGDSVQAAGQKMQSVGTTMTKYVTGPIVAAGAASMAAWQEVDGAMDIVVKKTGATGDALESLQGSVEKVATDIPTSFENAGIAIGEVNTRFGEMGETLEGMSESFIKFSDITDTDLNTSIGSAARIMEQFGLDAEDLDTVLDAFAATGQKTGKDVGEMMSVIEKNGNVLRDMDLGFEESVALLGEFEKAGIDAETALSGLSKAAVNWQKDGKSVTDGLEDMIKAMQDGEVTTEDYAAAVDLFGTKAADRFVDMAESGRLSMKSLKGDLGDFDGTVERTFAGTQDPVDELTKVLNELKITGADIAATMQELLVPVLQELNEFAKEFQKQWSGMSDEEQKSAIKTAALAAAAGPLLTIGGKLVSGGGALIKLAPKIGTALAGISGPVGIVIAAIAALVAAFATLWANDEGFRDDMTGMFDGIKESIEPVITSLSELWTNFVDLLKTLWDTFGETVMMVVESDLVNGLIPLIESVVATVSDVLNILIDLLNGDWSKAWEDAKKFVADAFGLIWDTISHFGNLMSTYMKGLLDGILRLFGTNLKELKETVIEKITLLVMAVMMWWNDLKANTVKIFTNIFDSVQKKVSDVKDAITEGIGEAMEYIKELPEKALQWGEELIHNFAEGIKGKVGEVVDGVKEAAQGVADYIHFSEPDKGPLSDFNSFAPDMMKQFADGIYAGIPQVKRAAEEMAEAVAQPVSSAPLTFNISNTINGAPGQNINDLAVAVDRRITSSVASKRAAWA